jgi:ankyrin repeat protein
MISLRYIYSIAIVVPLISGESKLEIHNFAWAGDFTRVKDLIESDPELISAQDDLRQIPLHLAARGGHPEIVQFLIDSGSPVNLTAYNNFTPLHLTSNGQVVLILIKAGANVKSEALGRTVLQNAASTRKMLVVEALLETGEALDLESAAELGHLDAAKNILARLPAPTREQLTNSLRRAAGRGYEQIVELLIKSGADVDQDLELANASGRWTPLSAAVVGQHWKAGKVLLDYDADPNVSGGKGATSVLHVAARCAPTWFVRLLLERGADPNSKSQWGGDALLQQVVSSGNWEVVELLLEFGADVNGGGEAVAPLLLAAAQNKPEIAGILIANGASIDVFSAAALGMSERVANFLEVNPEALEARDRSASRTPLAWAVAGGHVKLAEFLIERGAQVNTKSNLEWWQNYGVVQSSVDLASLDLTPLHYATASGDIDLVRLLLEHNADPNAQSKTSDNEPGATPLHLAATRGYVEIARLLLDHGANVNSLTSFEGTPLHMAAEHPEMIRLLLDHGADANATNKSGNTALDWIWDPNAETIALLSSHQGKMGIFTAIRLRQSQIAIALVEKSAELANAVDESNYKSSVLQAATTAGLTDVVKALLDHGANINYVDASQRTALWAAAETGNTELVRLYLSKGATLTQHYYHGSPLFGAARSGNVEIGRLLVGQGADVQQRTLGSGTLLHVAASHNKADFIRFLLEEGVDVNVDGRGDAGMRPLHNAARFGAGDAVRVLLDHGADIHARNYQGETALDCARDERDWWSPDCDETELLRRKRAVVVILEERLKGH